MPFEPIPTPDDLARDLAADWALCEAATPGPWHALQSVLHCSGLPTGEPEWGVGTSAGRRGVYVAARKPGDLGWEGLAEGDALMIAAARTGWPAALRRFAAAEDERDRLRAELAAIIASLDEYERDDSTVYPEAMLDRIDAAREAFAARAPEWLSDAARAQARNDELWNALFAVVEAEDAEDVVALDAALAQARRLLGEGR